MPAIKTKNEPAYYLVQNTGIDNTHIFKDLEDFQKFVSYLKGYISPIESSNNSKQIFTINGKTFYGKPHQPKNYHKKIEVLAYSLTSINFKLLIKENEDKSIERLIRSLCTRYSMYYNKKYKRSGPVFQGPYKSEAINSNEKLLEMSLKINNSNIEFSSYKNYKETKENDWLNINDLFSKFPEYNNLLPNSDSKAQLVRINLSSDTNNELPQEIIQTLPTIKRIPEILIIVIVLFMLIKIGINNINKSSQIYAMQEAIPTSTPVTTLTNNPSPTVLAVSVASDSASNKKNLIVNLETQIKSVPVYKNLKQVSPIIFYAVDGDIFEFTSFNSGMYKIKFSETESGYISEKFITVFSK